MSRACSHSHADNPALSIVGAGSGGRQVTPELRQELRRSGMVAVPNRDTPEHLRVYGLAPDVVADVGVDTGTRVLYASFPDAHFVLIDPRAESETSLTSAPRRYDFVACAAGASVGQMSLNIPVTAKGPRTAMAGFPQILNPMAGEITDYERREVPVRPLDDILAGYSGRVGLKIDTEGFERDVLKGASKTLERTEFVILELSLTKRFYGLAPPSDVIACLAASGLELRDILSLPGDGRGGPAPRYVDALFTRWNHA